MVVIVVVTVVVVVVVVSVIIIIIIIIIIIVLVVMSVIFKGSIPTSKCLIVTKILSGDEIKHNMILTCQSNDVVSNGTRIRKTSDNTFEVIILSSYYLIKTLSLIIINIVNR